MKLSYCNFALLSHCWLCESYNDGSQPLQTFFLYRPTYLHLLDLHNAPNSEQQLCNHLITVLYNLKLALSHVHYFRCLWLKNGGFGIGYSFIVRGLCKPDRRPTTVDVSDITKVCSDLSMWGKFVQYSKVEIMLPTFFTCSLDIHFGHLRKQFELPPCEKINFLRTTQCCSLA